MPLPHQPLTSIALSDLWVTYHSTTLGNMLVSVNLPSVSIEDLRPGLPREQAMVLSTTDLAAAAAAGAAAPSPWGGAVGAAVAPSQGSGDGGSGGTDPALVPSESRVPLSGPPPSLLTLEYRSIQAQGSGSEVDWAPLQVCDKE